MYVHFWIEERSRITTFDPKTNLVSMERPSWKTPVGTYGSQLADYYLDNVMEALLDPGQWYLDRPAGKLYYLPRPGETMQTAEIYAPRCLQLMGLVGNPEENRLVEHIRFEGITFAHTDWRHPDVSDDAAILGTVHDQKTHSRRYGRGRFAAAAQAACAHDSAPTALSSPSSIHHSSNVIVVFLVKHLGVLVRAVIIGTHILAAAV